MRRFDRACTAGFAIVTAAIVASVVGIDFAGVASVVPAFVGTEIAALQVELLERLTRILDRIADLLAQVNRVLRQFARLFGKGGGGG